jgi:dihydropteroate synthase
MCSMKTQVMGILNLTPDSFFDGSRMTEADDIRTRAKRIVAEGASVIDVGACSTRPGSAFASEGEELQRLEFGMPLIREVCPDIPLSIDTFRASIAEKCVREWNVSYINDISGGDEIMYHTAGLLKADYILTYNRKTQDDILSDMMSFFRERITQIRDSGVSNIILDPGFGFGKTLEQNYLVMKNISMLNTFNLPVLVGISRKSMIFKLLGVTPSESLNGTSVLNTVAVAQGAAWLRVHDVREAVETVKIVNAVNGIY